jgi:predicted nucleotidyltransferase
LRDLVAVAFGPRFVVEQEFGDLKGLAELAIFGSWAARYRGQRGPVPGDVDVLVVGPVDRTDVYDAADRAAQRLHREVNPTIMSVKRWTTPAEAADPFVRELRSRPILHLHPSAAAEVPDPDEEP